MVLLIRARDHRQSRVLRESGIGLAWRVNNESPLVHADGQVEHDVDGRALAQLDFARTRQEDRREPNRSARASADTRCFPAAVREAAYGRSRPRESRNSSGVAPAVAALPWRDEG